MASLALASNSKSVDAKPENGLTSRFNWIWILWFFVGFSFVISAWVAYQCMIRGGSLAWSTRYGVWIQVACNIR